MKRHFISLAVLALVAIPLSWAHDRKSTTTIPAGTEVNVRVTENLSSETAQPGDTFHGVLETPLQTNGSTAGPAGAGTFREAY